jgi:hypothetical protein
MDAQVAATDKTAGFRYGLPSLPFRASEYPETPTL